MASARDRTVVDDGATIDVVGGLRGLQMPPMTDNDLICLLTTAVKRINLTHCRNLTNASIEAIARNCPYLSDLRVGSCRKLTDASIAAVAAGCPNLKALMLDGSTKLTKVSLAAIASSCPNLESLAFRDCRFTALPENIGNLSKLRSFDAGRNLLTRLPLSIVQLDVSCRLQLDGNPLQTPPSEIAEQGLPAIRRYFEEQRDSRKE